MASFKVNDVVRVINDPSEVRIIQARCGLPWSDDMASVRLVHTYCCIKFCNTYEMYPTSMQYLSYRIMKVRGLRPQMITLKPA